MKIIPYSFFTTLCILFVISYAPAQEKSAWPPRKWPHDPKNCHHLLANSYQCGWQFFEIKGTLDGTVIACDKVNGKGSETDNAAVCILKTAKDTIRVMLLGNTTHKPGEHMKVTNAREPESDIAVPLDREYYMAEEKKGNKQPRYRVNQYDERVSKTAWAQVSKS